MTITFEAKRKPGRPRKIILPRFEVADHLQEYNSSEWFRWPATAADESDFQSLLAAGRQRYASDDFNGEIVVCENASIRCAVTPPAGRWTFTPEGLSRYILGLRPPFTHDGTLTPSGIIRAQVELCRERILAGATVDPERTPNLRLLREYLDPLFCEL